MKNYVSRRENIRITAIEIIFQEGFQALSVSNIAKKEGIAPSLLYKYYGGMDELFKEIITELGKFDARIFQSIKTSDGQAKEKLKKFVQTLGEYYQNYPEITPLLNSYEFFRSVPKLEEEIFSLLSKQKQYLKDFIGEGVKNQEFSPGIDPDIYSTILAGALRQEVLQWQIRLQKGGIKEAALKTNLLGITEKIISAMEN